MGRVEIEVSQLVQNIKMFANWYAELNLLSLTIFPLVRIMMGHVVVVIMYSPLMYTQRQTRHVPFSLCIFINPVNRKPMRRVPY